MNIPVDLSHWSMHEIKMGKTPKQVMKDTKRQEAV